MLQRGAVEGTMKAITSEMMREIDSATIEGRGIPGIDLMERAGSGVAARIIDLLGDTRGKGVSIFCGRGNNGGDGFVVARILSEAELGSDATDKIIDLLGQVSKGKLKWAEFVLKATELFNKR